VRTRVAPSPDRQRRAALVWFGAAMAALLVSVPWPFLPYGRPLFRW
jgi:hypothetical protein